LQSLWDAWNAANVPALWGGQADDGEAGPAKKSPAKKPARG